VLQASRIRIQLKLASATRLQGHGDLVDTTAGTVTVLGIAVSVTDTTHFEDHASQKVNTFNVADVHAGDWLDIRGSESPAGSNKLVATRFERVDAQPSVWLAGTVKTAAQPNFTILSGMVATTPTTQLSGASHRAVVAVAFFANLVGQTAAARGTWDGTTLTAQQASLSEGEDD
jgi:Domain of unknown function (DUF5666)